MYKTLLAINNYGLLQSLSQLSVWGESSGFYIEDAVRDGINAVDKLNEKSYDMVITEIRLQGIDGLELLRKVKEINERSKVVLCSELPDFYYARQGIILGAYDYIVPPFDESVLYAIFARIKNEETRTGAKEAYCVERIVNFFENYDNEIYQYTERLFDGLYETSRDIIAADKAALQICKSVLETITDLYEWTDLYFDSADFYECDEIDENDNQTYRNNYRNVILNFYNEFKSLYPRTSNAKINEVILYTLNNPESNLKRKNIADELYINSSYLSTVFYASTEVRFVDYLTNVKLKRAAWLLKNTDMKVALIAARLDYKDTGYFSRLFKDKYGLTPMEYRTPGRYSYII